MDWAQVLFVFLGNAGIIIPLFIWIKGGQDDMSKQISVEMKDFHGRLCCLEEKYIQMIKTQEEARTQMIQKIIQGK